MRTHPLLAFATATTISLTFGVLHHTASRGRPDSHSHDSRSAVSQRSTTVQHVELLSYSSDLPDGVAVPRARPAGTAPRPPGPSDEHTARAPAEAGGVWAELRTCESHGNYAADTGNGYYGAYQFSLGSWWSIGYRGAPNTAPPTEQDTAARLLEQRQGWRAWPVCAYELGLSS
jgi:hypothetical protein